MKPDFSEFSYGYAVTEELVNWYGLPISAVPVFPSLQQEGRGGGGYDVRLDLPGLPLFLQFKCTRHMERLNAKGFTTRRFTAPYYQMDLRPTSYSDQHPMLLDLESKGNEVYYVAPVFHLLTELNQAYIRKQVVKRSKFIRPSIIGTLPDAKPHSWAFDELGNACLFSEPRPTEAPIDSEQFSRHLLFQFKERGFAAISQSALSKLEENLISIISQRLGEGEQILGFGSLQERLSPLERISYLARMFLDCAFFVIREK